MRTSLLCSLVFVTSCAANNRTPLPAPSSLRVDPMVDIRDIPAGSCPGFDDHVAISTNGMRALLESVRETQEQQDLELARCGTAARLAQSQARQAEKDRATDEWKARWGLPIGVGIGAVVTAAIAAALTGLRGR